MTNEEQYRDKKFRDGAEMFRYLGIVALLVLLLGLGRCAFI